MGRSAHLCGCPGGGARIVPPDWAALATHRERLNGCLEIYLAEPACVKGAPTDARGCDEYIDDLTDGFVAILKNELNGHDGCVDESLASMLSFSVIYSELWRIASQVPVATTAGVRVQPTNSSETVDRAQLKHYIAVWDKWSAHKDRHRFIVTLGVNLAGAYRKAIEEHRTAVKAGDLVVIKHHATLIGDTLQDMLALLQHPDSGDNDYSEYALPVDHPHYRTP